MRAPSSYLIPGLYFPGDTFLKPHVYLAGLVLADLLKCILACSTDRTNPVIRQLFERCSWLDVVFRIPLSGVVFIATNCAFIYIHAVPPFLLFDIRSMFPSLLSDSLG
jgi:hypothetical protein